jgi:hypothetical protein
VALKVPAGQSAHVRSLEVVAAVSSVLPSGHVVSVEHTLPSFTSLKLVPATHAAHWRSTVVLPSTDFPSPTGHVVRSAHAAAAVAAWNCPAGHAAHASAQRHETSLVQSMPLLTVLKDICWLKYK